jgi:hypothetical protein
VTIAPELLPNTHAGPPPQRAISDFRVMGDQDELFGPVTSVPTC